MSSLAAQRLGRFSSNLFRHQLRRNATTEAKSISAAASRDKLVQSLLVNGKKAGGIFLYYAKVELTPPMPTDMPHIVRGFGNLIRGAKTGSWKNVTFREAWLNGLVTVEVLCWFFVGECLGKGGLVGYSV